jgi:hypothetical protein
MGLSDDQRALLRLLAQREQGYEDIAALKGKSVEEVREEVREALAALDAPPPKPSPPPAPGPEPAKTVTRPSRPGIPVERRRIVLIAGGALAIVAIVLGAVAILGGGSGSEGSSSNGKGGETALADLPAATNAKVTRAVLEPVDGGDAEGLAIFGRARKQVRLAVAANGLEPAPGGQAYVLWLAASANRMVPVTTVTVSEAGKIAAQYPIPTEVLVYLAEGAFDELDVSLVSTARYKAAYAKARKQGKLPTYTGADVLRGNIVGPIVGAAKKQG